MKLSEYILLPTEKRVEHIDLSTECLCGPRPNKRLILKYLGVENDISNWNAAGINRVHVCQNDSTNGWCRNPQHYFLGTVSENQKNFAPGGVGYTTGKGVYVNPETSEKQSMTRVEAQTLGWVGHATGKSVYMNPQTGEKRLMTRQESETTGWVSIHLGLAPYRDPVTGSTERLSREEADKRGWVGCTTGKTVYKDPETGEMECITGEEAEQRGWVHSLCGTTFYRNPDTGEVARMSKEEASSLGWVGATAGTSTYKDPATGQTKQLTKEEADGMGWVHLSSKSIAITHVESGECLSFDTLSRAANFIGVSPSMITRLTKGQIRSLRGYALLN